MGGAAEDSDTEALERSTGAGSGAAAAAASACAQNCPPAIASMMRELVKGMLRVDRELARINLRLERGSMTLDGMPEVRRQAQDLRDGFVELRTQVKGLLWVVGVTATAAIGSLVAAVFALIGH